MKRQFLSALVCSLLSLNASTAPVGHQATVDAVYKQQQTFVTGLIKHCKDRLPIIVDPKVAHKNTLLALDELNAFASKIKVYPISELFTEEYFETKKIVYLPR